MSFQRLTKVDTVSRSWLYLWVSVVLLGIFFRCAYLGEKIYWVDEVVTSFHVAGYTQQEVFTELSAKDLIRFSDLQKYQQLSQKKDFLTTLEAFKENPEHSPLYFILTRFWVDLFGNSVVIIRSLSVVFSLLTLPCFYWLSLELFKSPVVGWIGVAFLSVSPFHVYYGQEARPYSLWTVTILLSNLTLLRAIRLNSRMSWLLYMVSLVISFYTFLLSVLVAFGQILYVLVLTKLIKKYLFYFSLALLIFSPWLIIVIQNLQLINENTTWMRESIPLLAKVAIWFYGVSSIFIELPINPSLNIVFLTRVIIDLNLLALLFFSVYFIRQRKTGIFIACTGFFPALILILMDLIFQGQGSTAPRYMIPFYLGLQLILAYLLGYKIFFSSSKQIWQVILILILSINIISCSLNIDKSPRYQKTRNLYNIPIAKIINQAKFPLLISEKENILDLISLSYSLKKQANYKIISDFSVLWPLLSPTQELFLFNPSLKLINQVKQEKRLDLKELYQPTLFIPNELYLSIWQVKKTR